MASGFAVSRRPGTTRVSDEKEAWPICAGIRYRPSRDDARLLDRARSASESAPIAPRARPRHRDRRAGDRRRQSTAWARACERHRSGRLRTARANAISNAVGHRVDVIRAAGVPARRFAVLAPFDLVFANILLEPLQHVARPLSMLLAPNPRVILLGLLPSQAYAALAAYMRQNFRLERRITLDDWVTLVLRRG